MKLFIKFLLLIVVIGMAGPFFIKGPDGKPIMTADKLMPDWRGWLDSGKQSIDSGLDAVDELIPVNNTDDDTLQTVYRWQDQQGATHVSDTPPVDSDYEVVVLNSNTNVIQSPKSANSESGPENEVQLPSNTVTLPPGLDREQILKELEKQQ